MSFSPNFIRNVAIIAHVDHGKTTLVDHLVKQALFLKQSKIPDYERFMDCLDLERERGITIAAKNASFEYKSHKINIVDTPGHADFSGEVERSLNMVDGAILLVDAAEGVLPQTRFVLSKALENQLKIIVCINKIDRPDARPEAVVEEVFDLMVDLDAPDDVLDFEPIFLIARQGIATKDWRKPEGNLEILYEAILNKIPPPRVSDDRQLSMLVSNIAYNNYVGRLAIGRIFSGSVRVNDEVLAVQESGQKRFKVVALYGFDLNQFTPQDSLGAGDIAVIAGLNEIQIGDTITDVSEPKVLPRIKVQEPTVAMVFAVNDGPFGGKEGTKVTSRQIFERLEKEALSNVSIRIEKLPDQEAMKVYGRGELQLAILIEQMRREGFELCVSKPEVVIKSVNGKMQEPYEKVQVDVPEEYIGVVTEKLGRRKGILLNVINKQSGRVRMEFRIPSRGLIGYRGEFLTDTKGLGLMNSYFDGWDEYAGTITYRVNGALISDRQGVATQYALYHLQERGRLFIEPGTAVYQGMIVGEHSKSNDLEVNVCREKKLTNIRAAGADEKLILTPPVQMTLEKAMEWINEDELVEVTPQNIRIRVKILDPHKRKKAAVVVTDED